MIKIAHYTLADEYGGRRITQPCIVVSENETNVVITDTNGLNEQKFLKNEIRFTNPIKEF